VRLAAGVAAAAILAVAAAFIGNSVFSDSSEPDRARRAPARELDLPRGFVRFRDRPSGFSIAHPSDWVRLPSPSSDVRILAARAGASFSLRISTVGLDIGPQSLGPARNITDKLVSEAGPIRLLRKPQTVTLGGLPGYLYLYTFRDPDTKQTGVHAHYFLFRGKRLYALVFQALPAATFRGLTRTFDAIAETLRVNPPREGVGGGA
jgi:hypothetical protein